MTFKEFMRAVAIPTILALALLTFAVWLVYSAAYIDSGFNAQDAYVQECLASERYTREECLLLADVECR